MKEETVCPHVYVVFTVTTATLCVKIFFKLFSPMRTRIIFTITHNVNIKTIYLRKVYHFTPSKSILPREIMGFIEI